MDDEEIDFDDPRFLLVDVPAQQDLSYAEKRRRTLAKSEERNRNHRDGRSLKQREAEAREEGLRTNLIAKDTEEGGSSKALKMMKGMGFKPGEGLGKKRPLPSDEDAATSAGEGSSRGGIGSGHGGIGSSTGTPASASRASTPAQENASVPRTQPIMFHMREGRLGLGIPNPKQSRKLTPAQIAAAQESAASQPLPDVHLYLERNRGSFDERKAQGVLRSVRKTLEELDRRNGIEDSIMWKAPEDAIKLEKKMRARRAYLGGDADPDADFGVDVAAEREDEDLRKKNKGSLAYETGLSETVVDEEDDEKTKENLDEEAEWLSMETSIRLALTLAYLRATYHYCFWCGCQYGDEKDLKDSCPGEDEADH
ncbi:hypothetical protein T439DRAFT_381272 [Meredithblackwellia eburnea MCA 4105]